MILLDTSGILAALFEDQRHHQECAQVLREAKGPLILSPFVLADACAVMRRVPGAEQLFLEEVARRAYELAAFNLVDIDAASRIVARQNVGLTTASIFVLAESSGCRRVLTLRKNGFPSRFRILPA